MPKELAVRVPKVLAAIDGSEYAMRALRVAAELFGPAAEYVLLSVVPPWSPTASAAAEEHLGARGTSAGAKSGLRTHGTSTGTIPFSPTADAMAVANDTLHDYYRTAQRQAAAEAGISAEHTVEEAKHKKRRVGRAICESAAEHGADVVVIGAHGSSHTGEVLLGSVSQYVLHHASCPVLVVRPS